MRYSNLFIKTKKRPPKDAQIVSHKLLVQAGYIQQVMSGVYLYTPIFLRVIQKLKQIIREELNKVGAQELLLSQLQPKELWIESGRWEKYTNIDQIMFAFKDRKGREISLGPTHEEVITYLARHILTSYKDLPKNLYQIQNKFRDEIRPRFGLLRTREFIMKDSYSFDLDYEGLEVTYKKMFRAYSNIFQRCNLDFKAVEADPGAIGGGSSHEFMVLAENGEDTIIYCPKCGYAANVEKATFRRELHQKENTTLKQYREVYAENITGIDEVSKYLGIPKEKCIKTVIYKIDNELVAALIPGNMEINEVKLLNYFQANRISICSSELILKYTGARRSYVGPVNLPRKIKIIADLSVKGMKNFVAGCNKTNYYAINVNLGRDFRTPPFVDVAQAKEGYKCINCGSELKQAQGIEVGHLFKLGTKYSEKMDCRYLDKNNKKKPMVMGCYGIGVTRLLAACVEQNHDKEGIIWPISIAPFQVIVIGLNLENKQVKSLAEEIYRLLIKNNVEVLFDDREGVGAGEKFKDADLLGIPYKVVISPRFFKGEQIEIKDRRTQKSLFCKRGDFIKKIKQLIGQER